MEVKAGVSQNWTVEWGLNIICRHNTLSILATVKKITMLLKPNMIWHWKFLSTYTKPKQEFRTNFILYNSNTNRWSGQEWAKRENNC